MTQLVAGIVPRLSGDERRIMAKPTVQLAMLGGHRGIVVEQRDRAAPTTIKSLIARGLARDKPDAKSRVMPLSGLGVEVNEALASGIETGTAKSEALSAEHESPTAESGDAQPTGSK